ncbi:hypothetical protein F8M41_008189 [Gigaspora margarita]|uniref:Uncharacterized protein n=1 Tax=Gigaspora margarita TaxID=4874 RepID=A0A8H4ER45_GIGMA|nr:hypothetical protein F8M41_008189 [Gigaspora margarita]
MLKKQIRLVLLSGWNWKELEEINDNNDEGKSYGTKKFLKGEALSLVCKRWNKRYQTGDKESDDLPISDQEVIQNTEYAESSECVTSEVGNINECVDVAAVVDDEILPIDPGGSDFLKMEETKLESKINSYLNLITNHIYVWMHKIKWGDCYPCIFYPLP